ncbi:hypothetical protein T08_10701 [Trichinella sp. T8]|nr:hypothetical protein T08_10701 [Trichinella sp. T8]
MTASGRVGSRKLWSGIFKCHNCGTQNMLARAEACHGQTGNMDARKWMQKMSYVLPKSLVAAAKTEEEIEEFLTSHEANDEESLNSQNCTVRVPDVDRGPADPKNFLVVVMAECEGLYTVGCRERKLASKFTAADLQVISENLLSIDEAPDAEIPLRTAVTKATGGQGYVKETAQLTNCSQLQLPAKPGIAKLCFIIDPLWYSLMPHRPPMDSLVSHRPQRSKNKWDHIRSRNSSTPIGPLSLYRPLRESHRPQGVDIDHFGYP